MSVLGRLLVSSAERLDLPDFLSIDSYVQGDFKYLLRSFVGADTPFVLKGFDVINPESAVGTQNISVRVADSVVYYPDSLAGPFFHGLEEGNTQSAPLVPELRKNATNYVYLTLTTTEAAKDTRAFWDPDKEGGEGGEFTQDVNTQTVLSADINVSVSSFPENTVPVCKVVVGANFIESIEDARDMMFRLGSGGLNPNPLSRYNWRKDPTVAYDRSEPNTVMTSALDPNPFQGGDKNIQSLKEWMDAVMTKLAELGGTTYWYEDTSVFNIISVFKDALATSIKSKGYWNSSDVSPGVLTWSEDIVIQSTSDLSEVIIRGGNKTLLDNEALYVDRVREVPINTGSITVEFFNGVDHVNGQLGSFENLSKGDWIKKADDPSNYNLRVEEFYAAPNKGGGVTAPGSALSVKLSAGYPGISENKQASYIKGVYLASEVKVADRAAQDIQDIAGNYYWLAMRSDTILNISDITTSTLTCSIADHDGLRAKVTSITHGLGDGQRITIAGSTNFDGTYSVSVEDADTFYISVVGGPHADEAAQSAFIAVVTTAARSTDNGLELESENHGLTIDQRAILSGTTNYNGDFQVYPLTGTTFSVPVSSAIVNETAGLSTAVNVYVRTDIGPTKLERGENKTIGEADSDNLMSFIGMDNDAQTHPNYYITPSYNTLQDKQDYNADPTDSLTERVSKLTAMTADKTQDKTISKTLHGVEAVTNVTNAANQDVTFIQKDISIPMTLTLSQPSSVGDYVITIDSTISLAVNQTAYVTIDRNIASAVVSSAAITVVNTTDVPLEENTFIIASRLSGVEIGLWDGQETNNFLDATGIAITEVTTLTIPAAAAITTGQYLTINSANDITEYYIWFNKDAGGGDPLIAGKTAIEVAIATGDTNLVVAAATHALVDGLGDFDSLDNTDGTITVTNSALGSTTDAANVDVGGLSVNIDTQGVGAVLHYILDGDLDVTAIKKLDEALFNEVGGIAADLADTDARVAQNNNLKLVAGGTWLWNIGSVNEIQSFTFSSVPTVGTWDLNDGSDTTAAIAFNADAATIKAAIELAFTTNSTTVNVTGDYTTGIVIEILSSNLGTQNYPQLISSIAGLDATITDATSQPGVDPVNQLTFDADAYVKIPGLADGRNTISAQTIVLTDGDVAYVDINRNAGVTSVLSVTVAQTNAVVLDNDKLVIARRVTDDVIVGTASFSLADGERLQLDATLEEINKYFGQLRIVPHESLTQRVRITGADITKLDTTVISQAVKNLLLSFDGAEVNFQTGKVLGADGFTPLGIDFTPAIPAAGQFRWFSVTLSPGAVNADNTINGQLIVLSGSADGATALAAIKPAFSKGTQLGMIATTSADGVNVSAISHSDIVQLGVGGGGGGGEGDANELLERVKNRLDNGQYDVVTPVVFASAEENLTDGVTTASYDVANTLYTFPLGTEQITSVQMLDSVFLTEGKDVADVELVAYWDLDELDAAATYEVSRDGGNEYQAVTMDRIGQSDTFYATHVFDDEATYTDTITSAVDDSDLALTDLILRRGQAFTVASQMTLKQLTLNCSVIGTMAGNVVVKVVNDNGGLPSEDAADILFESGVIDISALGAGDHDIVVGCTIAVSAGDYHLVIKSDLEYRDNYSVGVNEFRVRANSADTTPDSTSFTTTPWVASTSGKLMYIVEGRILDLRVRITGSVVDANLLGFGVFYDRDSSYSIISENFDLQKFVFSGDDNVDTFVITDFVADPILMTGYEIGTGQAYRSGAWSLNSNIVTFPANTFNKPGETITLEFLQVFKGSLQFDSLNRAALSENHLGSTNATLDFSQNGRGIILRNAAGVLVEVGIDALNNITISNYP